MATEPVTIVVGAEDAASQQLAKVGESVEKVEQGIQNFGDRANSAGFDVASLLDQFGGPELSNFAGQLGDAATALKDFNEQKRAGNKGLGAYKLALIAAVFEGGRQFGAWLSGAKSDLADFNAELERSSELQTQAFKSRDIQDQDAQLGLSSNSAERSEQLRVLISEAETRVSAAATAEARARKLVADNEEKIGLAQASISKLHASFIQDLEEAEASTADYSERLQDLRVQLRRLNEASERQAKIDAAKKLNDDARAVDNLIQSLAAQHDVLEGIVQIERERDLDAARRANASNADLAKIESMHNLIDASKELKRVEEERAAAQEEANRVAAQEKVARDRQAEQSRLKKENEALRERNRLEQEAARIIESNLTLKQRFEKDIANLKNLVGKGLLTGEEVTKEAEKLKKGVLDKIREDSRQASPIADNDALQSRVLSGAGRVDRAAEANKQRQAIDKRLERANAFAERQIEILQSIADFKSRNRVLVTL